MNIYIDRKQRILD